MDSDPILPRRWAMLALLALPLAPAGCGESTPSAGATRPVRGKVVFSRPAALSGLKVQFLPSSPGARPASGDLGADGSFTLATPGGGEGIAEGDYKVRLDRPVGAKGKPAASPIPPEYFDEDGAYLSATVTSDTTELPPFELKPIAGPSSRRPR